MDIGPKNLYFLMKERADSDSARSAEGLSMTDILKLARSESCMLALAQLTVAGYVTSHDVEVKSSDHEEILKATYGNVPETLYRVVFMEWDEGKIPDIAD